jgi:hypothetical protein
VPYYIYYVKITLESTFSEFVPVIVVTILKVFERLACQPRRRTTRSQCLLPAFAFGFGLVLAHFC